MAPEIVLHVSVSTTCATYFNTKEFHIISPQYICMVRKLSKLTENCFYIMLGIFLYNETQFIFCDTQPEVSKIIQLSYSICSDIL
jgi:hypothetical protein